MLHRLSLLLLLLGSVSVAPDALTVSNLRAYGIRKDPVGHGDGYVRVFCNSMNMGTTGVILNNPNPVWSETFGYTGASSGNELRLQVYDRDLRYDDHLGTCVTTIQPGNYIGSCQLHTGGKLEFRYSLK